MVISAHWKLVLRSVVDLILCFCVGFGITVLVIKLGRKLDVSLDVIITTGRLWGPLPIFLIAVYRLRSAEPKPELFAGSTLPAIAVGIAAWSGQFLLQAGTPPAKGATWWQALAPTTSRFPLLLDVTTPAVEELFFRGAIFGVFVASGHLWSGAFLSAILFAGSHLDPDHFFRLFFAGLVYAYLQYSTRSIMAPFTCHVLHNLAIDLRH